MTETVRKPMEVKKCVAVQNMSSDVTYYGGTSRYYNDSKETCAKNALVELESRLSKSRAQHNENLPAIENNKTLAAEIETFMIEHGFGRTFQIRDLKSRKQIKPWVSKTAGWYEDIQRVLVRGDSFEAEEKRYLELKKHFETIRDAAKLTAERDAEAAKTRAAAEAAKRLEDLKFVQICHRHGVSPVDDDGNPLDHEELLDKLREKHQRLDLAMAMLETRNDWNEGYYRVESALGRFKAETDEDREIEEAVSKACGGEDIDGRVFRDCHWNYSEIFATLDPVLYDDAMFLFEKSNTD